MKRVLAVLVAVASFAGLGWMSRHPYSINPANSAVLRLSWRMRGEAIQHCRARTKEELEALPEHMRTPQVCEGAVSSYRLELEINDRKLSRSEHRAAGAHADRPIYVFREVRLKPGTYHVHIEFESEADPHGSEMSFEQAVEVKAGQIALITTDVNGTSLVLR